MTEDKVELLDSMFPDGYLIIYTCPDKQIRLAMNNVHRDNTIFNYYDLILNEKEK